MKGKEIGIFFVNRKMRPVVVINVNATIVSRRVRFHYM